MKFQPKTLIDFKCAPQLVQPAIRIINTYSGDWNRIKSELVSEAKKIGYKAKDDNIISAYITPTLKRLHVITGIANNLELTSDGEALLSASKSSESQFKMKLASLLILIDSGENQMLIEHLVREHANPGTAVGAMELSRELAKLGYSRISATGTRLNGWISMLRYVGLIVEKDRSFFIDKNQLEVVQKGEVIPNYEDFRSTLLDCYEAARSSTEGSPYVPIEMLRSCVTGKLDRMWRLRFDHLLQEAIAKDTSISFVPATYTEYREGGIWIANKYYYFLAIYKN